MQQHILGFANGFCNYVLIKKDICNESLMVVKPMSFHPFSRKAQSSY
jgi:hypothetical protein